MEEPLRHATQFVRVLELAQHARDDEFQSIGLLAVEVRSRLETVHELWRAIREDTVLDQLLGATIAPSPNKVRSSDDLTA